MSFGFGVQNGRIVRFITHLFTSLLLTFSIGVGQSQRTTPSELDRGFDQGIGPVRVQAAPKNEVDVEKLRVLRFARKSGDQTLIQALVSQHEGLERNDENARLATELSRADGTTQMLKAADPGTDIAITTATNWSSNPVLGSSENGRFFLSHVDTFVSTGITRTVRVFRSTDYGASWTSIQSVGYQSTSSFTVGGHAMTVFGGLAAPNVLIVLNGYSSTGLPAELYTYTDTATVYPFLGTGVKPAVTNDYVSYPTNYWMYLVSYSANRDSVLFRRSTNLGATWSAPMRISGSEVSSAQVPLTKANTKIAFTSHYTETDVIDILHVVYTGHNSVNNTIDVYYTKSTDYGSTWSEPESFGTFSGSTYNDDLEPSIDASNNFVAFSFHAVTTTSQTGVAYWYSNDGGETWTFRLLNGTNTGVNAKMSALRIDPNLPPQNFYVAFTRSVDGNTTTYRIPRSNTTDTIAVARFNDLSSVSDASSLGLLSARAPSGATGVALSWARMISSSNFDIYFDASWRGGSGSAPTVSTLSASSVTTSGATLNGSVNPNGLSTQVVFQYGVTSTYDSVVIAAQSPLSGSTTQSVSAGLSNLAPSTTYYYRVVATNSQGAVYGSGQSFSTSSAGAPIINSFTPASGPVGTSVTISGSNFSGALTNNIVYFGATRATVTSATSTSLNVTVPSGATYAPVSVTVSGLTRYSRLPFVVTFTGGTISTSAFGTKVDFATGSSPNGIAVADLDIDGKVDVVASNSLSFTLSLYRNTSTVGTITTSSLSSAGSPGTGNTPREVAVGDLDGDGKKDIVVANQGSATVSVFHNTSISGSISFASPLSVATRTAPLSPAIGDIDGDGKPDLVVANSGSDTVSVYRNLSTVGSISFASPVHFLAGSNTHSVTIADFDGDGKFDIAATNNAAGTVSVYRNTSTSGSITTSSLASQVTFATASNPAFITAGDIDGDGKLDMIVTNGGSATVSVFRNTSTSGSITTSSFAAKVDFVTGTNPLGIALGDVDGDGKVDILVANVNSNTVSLFKNNSSSGSISLGSQITFATASGPAFATLGDIDGNGRLDVIVTNGGSNSLSLLRNTTVTAPTAPLLSSPSNGATGQSTSPSFSWGSVSNATNYHFQLSTSSGFSTTIVNDSTLTGTSTQASGLAGGTTHYWRVRAGNSEGWSSYSSTFSFTTGTTPAAPTLSSPSNGATGQPTSLTFSWLSSSGATSYRFQLATTSGFAPTLIDTPSVTTTSLTVSTLAYNTSYYWRVAGVNSFGTGSFSSSRTLTTTSTISYPSTTVHSFPSSPTQTSYRLFGMVGTSQLTFSNFVSGAKSTDYRIYADNGSSTNFLVEQDASNTMQVGKGYWIIKKTSLSVNSGSYPMPSLSSDGTFSITILANTWNLITNPFDRVVNWSRVLSSNGLSSGTNLWGWTGSWSQSTTLQPFIGYYFFNNSSLTSLKIPYPFTTSVQEPDPLPMQWKVSVTLEGKENVDGGNFIGVASTASEGMDDYDMRKPPLFGDLGYLYFVRSDWDEKFPRFSSDVRPSVGDGQVWNFEARNEQGSTSRLTFTGVSDVPQEYDVMLVNLYNSKPVDLRKSSEYSFTTVSERMPFRLIVGRSDYVREKISQLIPAEFALEQNFPNPFNPTTSITFRVPSESNVRLEVVNLLGQVVATLVHDSYRPGTYTVVWNGTNARGEQVASGVYFSRFIAGGRVVRINKMVLMK